MQGNLRKIIAACNVSKNGASLQVLFFHILRTIPKRFRSFSKFFQIISRTLRKKCLYSELFWSTFSPIRTLFTKCKSFCTIKTHVRFWKIHEIKIQIFNPVARGKAADNANGCQMMSYSQVEKHHSCCFSLNITKLTA